MESDTSYTKIKKNSRWIIQKCYPNTYFLISALFLLVMNSVIIAGSNEMFLYKISFLHHSLPHQHLYLQ